MAKATGGTSKASKASKASKENKRGAAPPSFYEVVFQGRPKIVRSFLAGLVLGAGGEGTVIYHFDAGIEYESKPESLAELVRLKPTATYVIVDGTTGKLIKRLRQDILDKTGLEIQCCRHIRSAHLPFKFKVYAAQYKQEIMDILKNLPSGLRLVDFVQDEKINPRALGPEAYAPAHDYEACGQGKVVGRVDRLIELRARLERVPLVEEGQIELRLA